MGYKFHTDQTIEEPFFREMAGQFGGKDTGKKVQGHQAYLVKCPCCKRKKAIFGMSKHRNTFILLCPVDICTNRGGTVLHEIIKNYGDKSIQKIWSEARWQTTYTDNGWKGIKNRVPYEDRKPKDKSFKQKMDLKTETSFIKMTCESPDLGCRPTDPSQLS